jgi:hypothetical protein
MLKSSCAAERRSLTLVLRLLGAVNMSAGMSSFSHRFRIMRIESGRTRPRISATRAQ